MKIEKRIKSSFSILGKEGSTFDGKGFIQNLWKEANLHFDEVASLAKKDENGHYLGFWGAMSDFTRSFKPWEDNFSKGYYLAGVECLDDAEVPEGWVKWKVPSYEYICAEVEGEQTFSDALNYMKINNLQLVGAVHDFTCPVSGKTYMFFPIRTMPGGMKMNKKVLVAYFSHTGENYFPGGNRFIEKGNTHIAAEMIAENCGGDLFEIKEAELYSENYRECAIRAKQELDKNARPSLVQDVDISQYDVIFLGYPNWCGTMPMPVWTFLENHDFSNKTICPFCTNEGSGLANSIADIINLVHDAELKDGLSIKGSQVHDAKDCIVEWIKSIL